MASEPRSESIEPSSPPAEPTTLPAAEQDLEKLDHMLETLHEPPADAARPAADIPDENRLVQVRLGMASSLYRALRAKHAPTALHSLRVALHCSCWAQGLGLLPEERDIIEVAALLHDVGKIGVSENVLLKPGELTLDETAIVDEHRRFAQEILTACSASHELLDVVHYAAAWYDGSREGFPLRGKNLPLGSRMIAIADAFDAMTSDHVYRRAMSQEWALAELFSCAGTQFDPELVESFNELQTGYNPRLHEGANRRWLEELNPEEANARWHLRHPLPAQLPDTSEGLFYDRLLSNMHDGVVFVDASLQIRRWNQGAERLTGLSEAGVLEQRWLPSMVHMADLQGKRIKDENCPIRHALETGTQALRRLTITNDRDKMITVDTHVLPVIDAEGATRGAAMVWHDASSESSLEERVQSLHLRATRDPLTQVANRAEFDRILEQFVEEHLQRQVPCSLIICDLDYFKSINDRFGHQAGDEVLVNFAALLRRLCRRGDLVARYGGEEFVMLCADCNNSDATLRAEEIRREFGAVAQPALGGRHVTSSFGVTELQQGDTAETILRRADRALLQAKEFGRNTVVQLGTGLLDEETSSRSSWLNALFRQKQADRLLERHLVTAVPIKVVVEKLRGFVADHHAQIMSISEEHLVLRIEGGNMPFLRRRGDRAVPLLIELDLTEKHLGLSSASGGESGLIRTVVRVAIRPKRNRDPRRNDAIERARQLLVSLKSYLMAYEYGSVSSAEMEASQK